MLTDSSNALVLGASGAIGQALINNFLNDNRIGRVIAVSRSNATFEHPKLHWISTHYDEPSMQSVVDNLSEYKGSFSKVCICHGILHGEKMFPEKRMEEMSVEMMQSIFYANTIVPSLWLKLLRKLVMGAVECKIACFSARVGSTGDNGLGGWYSYRASKAALNSLMKTFSIEYARRAKNVKLIAFHPGTTDTVLSKPFQASVKPENLFTTEFVAEHLVNIMNNQTIDGQLSFIDWENKDIVW